MRNLVKIYGEGWKYHYDTSRREASQRYIGGFSAKDSIMRSRHFNTTLRMALPHKAKSKDFMEVGFDAMSDHFGGSSSPLCSTESLSHGEFSESLAGQTCGQAPSESIFNFDSGDDEQVDDYTDLYSAKLAGLKIRDEISANEKRSSLLDVFSWNPSIRKTSKALSTETNEFSFFSKEFNTTNDAAINYDVCINKAIFLDGQAWGDYSDVNDDSEVGV